MMQFFICSVDIKFQLGYKNVGDFETPFKCSSLLLFLASEAEMPPAIRRAESCESVASDSSVLEMQPDMPKIGQLEFALEYDRYQY